MPGCGRVGSERCRLRTAQNAVRAGNLRMLTHPKHVLWLTRIGVDTAYLPGGFVNGQLIHRHFTAQWAYDIVAAPGTVAQRRLLLLRCFEHPDLRAAVGAVLILSGPKAAIDFAASQGAWLPSTRGSRREKRPLLPCPCPAHASRS